MARKSLTLNSANQTRSYQRWTAILSFVILGELGTAVWIDETTRGDGLVTTGLPIGAILAGAAVIGIVMSVIIFRTPHDGTTEL